MDYSRSSEDTDETLQLPWVMEHQEESSLDDSESEGSDEDLEVSTDCLHEGLLKLDISLKRDDRKKMAMIICSMTIMSLDLAAKNSCSCVSGASS